MRRLRFALIFLILAASVGWAVAGRARSDERSTTETVRTFIEAADRDDDAAARATVTKAAQANFKDEAEDKTKQCVPSHDRYEIGSPVVTGDRAEVPVSGLDNGKPATVRFKLRREADAWRIYALAVPVGDGNSLTLDFEHPEQIAAEALRLAGTEIGGAIKQAAPHVGDALQSIGQGLQSLGGSMVKAGEQVKH